MPSNYFDLIESRLTHWQNLRVTLAVRWMVLKLYVCGASPFLHHDAEGNEFLLARRPLLARLLFRRVEVWGADDPRLMQRNIYTNPLR